MLKIHVASAPGGLTPQAQPAEFDAAGGTIGRADSNRLVLTDPDRTVSRVHAQVVCRAGRYLLIDRGSNPVQVNALALEPGQEVALADGDRVAIGGYVLRVELPAGGGLGQDATGVALAGEAEPAPCDASSPERDGTHAMPGLAGIAAARADGGAGGFSAFSQAGDADDPFADLFGTPATRAAAPPADAGLEDVLAAPTAGPPASPFDPVSQTPGAPPTTDLLGLGGHDDVPRETASLDALFGLDKPSARMGEAQDPFADLFAGSALAEPVSASNTATCGTPLGGNPPDGDPLAALLGATPQTAAAPLSDHVPELNHAFVLPRAAGAPAPDTAALETVHENLSAPPQRSPSPMPPDEPWSAADTGGAWRAAGDPDHPPPAQAIDSPSHTLDASPPVTPSRLPVHPDSHRPAPRPDPESPDARAMAAPQGRAAPTSLASLADGHPAESTDALLAALLQGLGHPTLAHPALTPELMHCIGTLLRACTQGTLDLLLARAATKREVRAEVTMIVGRENNPLKFSPTVAVALAHLLNPTVPGFMNAEAAMQDACDDLRAHQFGFMAGMRAALSGVLARFEPPALEQRLDKGSMLDTMLPMSRRARLWDTYLRLYADISTEAEDDFHHLFGREFLRAYEEQIDRLKASAQRDVTTGPR